MKPQKLTSKQFTAYFDKITRLERELDSTQDTMIAYDLKRELVCLQKLLNTAKLV